MTSDQPNRTPFATLARRYLRSLDTYRDAKAAVLVARRIGHDAADLEFEAARVQAEHQAAFDRLVSAAAQIQAKGAT